ncbi:MAG: pilus assembly protein TadD [Bacteroidetes bacterium]|nr:pilus assembly protein TadD [Bacteroidota bacterium]
MHNEPLILQKHLFKIFKLFLLIPIIYSCSGPESMNNYVYQPVYLNHKDTVKYTGIESCKECHYHNYISYLRTGMGLSFDSATKLKSASVIGPDSILYDSDNDLYFHPYWDGKIMKVKEFRLEGADTLHSRIQTVDYIVGSGQHTNSHIYIINNYAYQIPFTYYTQDQKFDFPPGFEGRYNSRFSRKIGLECLSCHNSFPEMVMGSENKYTYIPDGINCEQCHGPGEIHVKLKKEGVIVDTSQFIDYSIVNPVDLSPERQMDICTRCHLQGTTVLKPGKSYYDFKPGMDLSKVMDVFMPRYKGGKEDFIMASHVERLKESRCYIAIGAKLNCIYCHKAHTSYREIDRNIYIDKCINCHNENSNTCSESENLRNNKDNNCITCHMAESGSRDIPHVRTHDHKIAIPPTVEQLATERKFLGLVSVNNPETDDLSSAKGYLLEYESYQSDPTYLDSAYYYLQLADWLNNQENLNTIIQYYYLKKDYSALVKLVEQIGSERMLSNILVNQEYSNYDAWTAYRIGQAYEFDRNIKLANKYYQKATLLAQYNLEFQNKLGSTQVILEELNNAKKTFEFILSENPLYTSAHVNYGYTLFLLGVAEKAKYHYDYALSLDPDHIQALVNKAGICLIEKDYEKGMKYVDRVLLIEPGHKQAEMIKLSINIRQ